MIGTRMIVRGVCLGYEDMTRRHGLWPLCRAGHTACLAGGRASAGSSEDYSEDAWHKDERDAPLVRLPVGAVLGGAEVVVSTTASAPTAGAAAESRGRP